MGLIERFSTIFKAKANTVAEKLENPNETLDYSFEKQKELITNLRRQMVQVVAAKKQLEIQKAKLVENITTLEQQAKNALSSNREDLARLALERKNSIMIQIQNFDKQILDIQNEQMKLENTERRLSSKIDEFRSRKEIIKAQYSAAEAQVKIKESVTGISEEMSDVGMALSRAEEKTEKMKAKAQAMDEMINTGVLTDFTSSFDSTRSDSSTDIELEKITVSSEVDKELAKMKAEISKTSPT
jgi:phage shock protein A